MIKKIGHVGVVVRDLDETLELYKKLYCLSPAVVKDAMDGRVRVAFMPVGDDEIELLQPVDPKIHLGEFLRKQGQGIHHISLTTDNLDYEIERMKEAGAGFTDDKPTVGAHGVRIIFTRPQTTGGVTVELCGTQD
jgi:methylmalonyl-CoA epimerase